MLAAVISLASPESRIGSLEQEQAQAICRALPAFGYEPLLVTLREQECADLPCLRLRSQAGLPGLFRLWRWQRRKERLLVMAVGPASVRLARRIQNMARKRDAALVNVFLLEPPAKGFTAGLEKLCICGSQYIASMLPEGGAQLAVAQPGIELAQVGTAPPGGRFVFGLAQSMEPASGALLVVRAMAALWQHELPEWEVRMFGGGGEFEAVFAEAGKMGVLSRLGIFGDQPLDYVAGQCNAWLAPGSDPAELPDTLWAGFAAGLPVICSDNGLHRERQFGQESALTVSGDNPQELARAMLTVLQNGELAAALAEAGAALRPLISLEGMAERICGLLPGMG